MSQSKITVPQNGGLIVTRESTFGDWIDGQGRASQDMGPVVEEFKIKTGFDFHNFLPNGFVKSNGAAVALLYDANRRRDYTADVKYRVACTNGEIEFIGRASRSSVTGNVMTHGRLSTLFAIHFSGLLEKHFEDNPRTPIMLPLAGAAYMPNAIYDIVKKYDFGITFRQLNLAFANNLSLLAAVDKNLINPDCVCAAMFSGILNNKADAQQKKTFMKQLQAAQVLSQRKINIEVVKRLASYMRFKVNEGIYDQIKEILTTTAPALPSLGVGFGAVEEATKPAVKAAEQPKISSLKKPAIKTDNEVVISLLNGVSPGAFNKSQLQQASSELFLKKAETTDVKLKDALSDLIQKVSNAMASTSDV